MDKYLNTILHFACAHNDYALVDLLLLKGADPNKLNKAMVSPTMIASRIKNDRMLKTLIKHGGSLPSWEATSKQDEKALNEKKRRDGDAIEQQYIDYGDDLTKSSSLKSNRANTSRKNTVSQENKTPSALDLNATQRSQIEKSLPSKLLKVYNTGYFNGLSTTKILDEIKAENMNYTDENGCTLLMKSAYKGNVAMIEKLIDLGVKVDEFDHNGNTALVWACIAGNYQIVEMLINAGADVNFRDENFCDASTPLIASSYCGHNGIVSLLLKNNADVNMKVQEKSNDGGFPKNALMIACWACNFEVVILLLEHGAFIDEEVKVKHPEWLRYGKINILC